MSFLETQDGVVGPLGCIFKSLWTAVDSVKEKSDCASWTQTWSNFVSSLLCPLQATSAATLSWSPFQAYSQGGLGHWLPRPFWVASLSLGSGFTTSKENEAQMPRLCFTFHFCGSFSSSLNTAPCDSLSTWLYPDLWCQIHIVISQVLLGSHLANNNKSWKHTSTLPTSSLSF